MAEHNVSTALRFIGSIPIIPSSRLINVVKLDEQKRVRNVVASLIAFEVSPRMKMVLIKRNTIANPQAAMMHIVSGAGTGKVANASCEISSAGRDNPQPTSLNDKSVV